MAFIFLCFEVLWNVQCCTFAQYHLHNMPVQYDIFDYEQRQVMFLLHVGEGGGSVVSFKYGGRNSSVGSAWAHCHSVAGSILLWGHFPVEGSFPLELTWIQTPFPQNSFGWEYKPRSSLCTHAFHRMDSKDPDVHVLDGWMLATKTHPARTIHEDGMWLP